MPVSIIIRHHSNQL